MAKATTRFRALRWTVQLLFLLLFYALFALTRYGAPTGFQHLFFRIDPLAMLVASIAGRALVAGGLLAFITVVGTLVFGRFFCGWVCPLGTSIDIFDKAARRGPKPGSRFRTTKYVILVFIIIAALLGASFVYLFDPLVIVERTLTLVVFPVFSFVGGIFRPMPGARFTETAIALVLFGTVLGLGLIAPRFWCRNICPLGGLLAFLAKFSPFRFRYPKDCRQCGACERICPTSAINSKESMIDSGECIDCFACRFACPETGISYRTGFARPRFDVTRRQALVALGSGIVVAPLARNLLQKKLQGKLIRPPGSIPEQEFLATCLHCGKCMKGCPTNGLQPCVLEAGVYGIWTPHLVPRIGGCEKNCNLCGQVCPTNAIRKLPLEEKQFAVLGKAVVDKHRCIAWEQDKHCLVCDEICPYDAIAAVPDSTGLGTSLRPAVNEDICIGCGLCESRCPVAGAAAIQVYSLGEERKRTGPYRTEAKTRLRECGTGKPENIPSGFIVE